MKPTTKLDRVTIIRIHEAVLGAFQRFGNGPYDLEAIIYVALNFLEVTPFNYMELHNTVKQYIINSFEIRQGNFIRLNDITMRRILVYRKE